MAEIKLQALAHSYDKSSDDPSYAIREMTHTWEQGGAYALLGPSGCGKSTLLNIISGLLKPSDGQVLFDGKVMNEVSPQERNIAQVFQFPVVYDTMSVYDNLAFPLRNMGAKADKVDKKVNEIAQILELESVLKHKAFNLSADEKQKVSMGRGLVRDDVSAILFDEPLTVIDPHLKWKLRRKLKQIHEQFKITMVYVTHDQLEASTFADKIAVMYDGQVVQFGTPRELFEKPNHTFVGYFIGSPGMNLLDVSFKDDCLLYQGHQLPISEHERKVLQDCNCDQLKLGIRPEFVHVWEHPQDQAMLANVLHVEDLGSYKILSLELGNTQLKARLLEDQKVPQQQAYISFPEQWQMIYVDDYLIAKEQTDA